jgi:hypothetical protein
MTVRLASPAAAARSGTQAEVFELCQKDGSSVGKVLKMVHSTVQHAFHEAVAGSMMNLEKVCARARGGTGPPGRAPRPAARLRSSERAARAALGASDDRRPASPRRAGVGAGHAAQGGARAARRLAPRLHAHVRLVSRAARDAAALLSSLPRAAERPRRVSRRRPLDAANRRARHLTRPPPPHLIPRSTVMLGDGKRATAHFQGMVMEKINGARGRAARGAAAASAAVPRSRRRPCVLAELFAPPAHRAAAARRLGRRPPRRGPRLPQHPLRARDALSGPLRARPRAARGRVRTEPAGSLAWPVDRLEWVPIPAN